MPLQLLLDVLNGPRKGETFAIPNQTTFVVGRLPSCGMSVDDPTVSREHFRIEYAPPICRLIHVSEKRFTKVNNVPVSTVELYPGDEITFGTQNHLKVRGEFHSDEPIRPMQRSTISRPPGPGPRFNPQSPTDPQVVIPSNEPEVFESLSCRPKSPMATVLRVRRSFSDAASESLVASIRSSNTNAMFERLEQLVFVLQQAASTTDFVEKIAHTAMDMVHLDRAAVLLREGAWQVVASAEQQIGGRSDSWYPSQKLLDQLVRDRCTLWGQPGRISLSPSDSVAALVAVVAAPILDSQGEVIGAVYGDRRIALNRPPIDQFDAKMVEIMACGVAGGWARMEQEQAAVARRVQLERFVTKEVARQLEEDPDALIGRDEEVTMLFCDIAGFSRISEQLSPKETFDWINAVMETLSNCVLATKGTLVDYVGDELIAMWGAPLAVADHAAAAAETAIMMLNALKTLNEQYPLPAGESTQIGIGLNSGKVRVGNTGSIHKLKYGPLGSHVNIASRVQGATRYLRTPALITGATAQRLDGKFCTRRLCSVRLKNIEQPVELFELVANPGPTWIQLAADYESALKAWEQRQLQLAIETLSQLVGKVSHDGPTMVLLARAVDVWSRDQREYDPVWTLPSK